MNSLKVFRGIGVSSGFHDLPVSVAYQYLSVTVMRYVRSEEKASW